MGHRRIRTHAGEHLPGEAGVGVRDAAQRARLRRFIDIMRVAVPQAFGITPPASS